LASRGHDTGVTVRSLGLPFEVGIAAALFDLNGTGFFPYDVAADGRFLVNTPSGSNSTAPPVNIILNWQAALKR
jgi:hypothetical protein